MGPAGRPCTFTRAMGLRRIITFIMARLIITDGTIIMGGPIITARGYGIINGRPQHRDSGIPQDFERASEPQVEPMKGIAIG